MKKKLFFLMTLALMGWSNVWADNWYISYYLDDSWVENYVQLNPLDVEGMYTCTFTVSYTTSCSFNVRNDGWGTKYGYSSENVTATNTDVELSSGANVCGFQLASGTYYALFDLNNATIRFAWNPFIILNGDATTAQTYEAKKYDLTLNRTFTANKWQSICIPAWFGEDNITGCFGDGTQVAKLTGEEDGVLNFSTVTTMLANTPYLIKPTNTTMAHYAVWVEAFSPDSKKVAAGDYTFVGVNAETTTASGDYFLTNEKLRKSNGTTKVKATRAYFKKNTGGLARELTFVIDGEVTSIDQIDLDEEIVEGAYYDLQGRRVAQPTKGIYIVNGKKVVIN